MDRSIEILFNGFNMYRDLLKLLVKLLSQMNDHLKQERFSDYYLLYESEKVLAESVEGMSNFMDSYYDERLDEWRNRLSQKGEKEIDVIIVEIVSFSKKAKELYDENFSLFRKSGLGRNESFGFSSS